MSTDTKQSSQLPQQDLDPAQAPMQTRQRKAAAKLEGAASRFAQISVEGAKSGAYFYPIKGVYYLVTRPRLLQPLLPMIGLSIFVSLVLTVMIFATLYFPAVAVLAVSNGPVAFVSAATFLLSFSGTVVNATARSLFLQAALERLFDQVLLDHDLESLVSRGREVKKAGAGKRLGQAITKPLQRFSPQAILRYLISIPLNFIPLVGTIFFIIYNGITGGPGYHTRYFQLKKMSPEQKDAFIRARRGAYSSFGVTAMALNVIPLASLFFSFTTEVGAALWACDEEKRGGLVGELHEGSGAVKR